MYRRIAKVAARLLGRSELVETVYIRRSVAAGEVVFGRSDIDLGIVVKAEAEASGEALLSLARRFQAVRRAVPLVGEGEVRTPRDVERWIRTDTYRGSLERRVDILAYGKPLGIPPLPVAPEHAARWVTLWLEHHFPRAVQQGNARNLRKFAAEMWNAYATATGILEEPLPSRAATVEQLRESGELDLREATPEETVAFCLQLAETFRDRGRRRPALGKLARPVIFRAVLPPLFEPRTFVVVPEPGWPLPPEAFQTDSFVSTPEALDLYVHDVNGYAFSVVPQELRDLGLCAPERAELVRSCRHYGSGHYIRSPGFLKQTAAIGSPQQRVSALQQALTPLEQGEVPGPLSAPVTSVTGMRDYYRVVYPPLCAEFDRLWAVLDDIPDRTAQL
jgi:predicted nucleotidyltransferase